MSGAVVSRLPDIGFRACQQPPLAASQRFDKPMTAQAQNLSCRTIGRSWQSLCQHSLTAPKFYCRRLLVITVLSLEFRLTQENRPAIMINLAEA